MLKNQECYDKNGSFLGWFSRSVAVVGIIFKKENGKMYVLASQRGEGTPDPEYRGKWNLVCGYLDFSETIQQCLVRECYEETGVNITDEKIKLVSVNSNPKDDKRQNVTMRFLVTLSAPLATYKKQFSHKHNEKDEVGQIKFIELSDIDKYEWAFNHKQLINKYIK